MVLSSEQDEHQQNILELMLTSYLSKNILRIFPQKHKQNILESMLKSYFSINILWILL